MDPIDAAVDAAGTPAKMVGVRVRVSTGRIVTMLVPLDMTEQERLDLTGFVAVSIADELEKKRAAAKPRREIFVPAHMARGG